MSIEMEIPKVLWLKENMPTDLFRRCKFYDLADVLTHIATGKETRSYCSTVCKQGFVPVGIDGSVKGWQEDFLQTIGLPELCEDNFRRMGGVHGEVLKNLDFYRCQNASYTNNWLLKNGTMLSAGQLVGTLCGQSAAQLGLVPGIKIGSGVIDAYAGWIGTVGAKVNLESISGGVINKSCEKNDLEQAFCRLAAVAGTSTCHLVMSREPKFVPGVW